MIDKTNLLTRRVVEVIEKKSLEKKLKSGKKLRIKLGIDPTGSELHLGHAVTLWKLREFQEAGHKAVFIIGDWTARIGDPSGKNETRQPITEEEIGRNAKDFFAQANLILDKSKTEVHLQSEWFSKFGLKEVFFLTAQVTVKQLLAHDTFRMRLKKDLPFYQHETLYPLLQGYDSVAIKSDVELGASEQKFNLLMGREIQRAYNQTPQDIMMVNYLIGLDGKQKMGKTTDNFVSLREKPDEMFGKLMSIPDNLIGQYFELCTNVSSKELVEINKALQDRKVNPRDLKIRLARLITEIYHGSKKAQAAEENFSKKFGRAKGELEADFGLHKKPGNYDILVLLVEGGLASSKSDARRKIKEGAVEVDGIKIDNEQAVVKIKKGSLIRLGKRFLRIQ